MLLTALVLAAGFWLWRANTGGYRVALDAGHGGDDPGAMGLIAETELTETTARYLEELLRADENYTVILCRDYGEGASSGERGRRAARRGAQLLLSIHGNSSQDGTARGFECYPQLAASETHADSLRFAQLIASGELLDPATRTVVECAALVHDIGIHAAEEKYGRADGKHQEAEGPALAQALLGETALDKARCERVCWLVGHHHTYAPVDGIDHQILLEADALVNLYEDQVPLEAVAQAKERLFRTETGRRLVTTMFGV